VRAPRRLIPVLALVALVVPAGSASASVAALQRVAQTTVPSSTDKGISATCPPGKRLLGAAGGPTSLPGRLPLTAMRPDASLTSVFVAAAEDEAGVSSSWDVTAVGICATPPAGMERAVDTSMATSDNKTATASCSAGKQVVGVGGEITGAAGEAWLDDLRPNPALTSVTVQGVEDETGTAESWSVTAYAICANPVAGLYRLAVETSSTSASKHITPVCPTGTRLLSVGGELFGGAGRMLTSLGPFDFEGLTTFQVHASEDHNGTSSSWLLRAFGICAHSSKRLVGTSTYDSSQSKGAFNLNCAPSMQATGFGVDITGGGGQVQPTMHTPGYEAWEDTNGYSGSWSVSGFTICATPLAGRELKSAGTTHTSEDKSVTISCPTGKKVVGAAGRVTGSSNVTLDDIIPNGSLNQVTARGVENEFGTINLWTVHASAVCATPPPGLQRVVATGEPDSDPQTVTAACPAGKNLLGTGADIIDGDGQVIIDGVRPNELLNAVTVTALEDGTGTTASWYARAFAICADA
jgi:hypothetical protein